MEWGGGAIVKSSRWELSLHRWLYSTGSEDAAASAAPEKTVKPFHEKMVFVSIRVHSWFYRCHYEEECVAGALGRAHAALPPRVHRGVNRHYI